MRQELDKVYLEKVHVEKARQMLRARRPAVAYAILMLSSDNDTYCLTTFAHSIKPLFDKQVPNLSHEYYERALVESIATHGGCV